VIIYLLGPSGVGKSNAVQLLRSDQPQLDIVDLDADFPGRQFDWHAIEPRLAQLHQQPVDGRHVVVDVGAGTQTLSEFSAFLRGAGALVIVVTAPPEQVVLRQPIPNRRVDEFITTEYATRQQLYGLAAVTVDVTGLGKEAAAQLVVDRVAAVLGSDGTDDGPAS
jgi:hypothetical protein